MLNLDVSSLMDACELAPDAYQSVCDFGRSNEAVADPSADLFLFLFLDALFLGDDSPSSFIESIRYVST